MAVTTNKSGYKAPAVLKGASEFHKVEGLGKTGPAVAFRWSVTVSAVVLILGAIIGMILGFRTTRPAIAIVLLVAGLLIPIFLYRFALGAAPPKRAPAKASIGR